MATSSVSGGKRIIISTVTASFDFESATQHNLFVSASDNHHGNTSGSYLTTLPIRINVTDNMAIPTMGSQYFRFVNIVVVMLIMDKVRVLIHKKVGNNNYK